MNSLAVSQLSSSPLALIDVRSETEFERSGIPGFVNLPLLYQAERSQVGLCYKQQGQPAAIALGHRLVDPHRAERVAAWAHKIRSSPAQEGLVMCWRGGLRSQIAVQWMQEAGLSARQLPGGYKRVRQALLEVLQSPPPLFVLTGLTGSGKTELLKEFMAHAVDIEAAARHRGSAFGASGDIRPSQTVFENTLALGLFKKRVLVEDESRLLGRLCIPECLYQSMLKAPVIQLEVPLEERLQRIYQEYVINPLEQGTSAVQLEQSLTASLDQLKRRLDKHYPALREALQQAFSGEPSLARHAPWIEGLLQHYYDRLYQHALKRSERPLLFRGDRAACRAWLQQHLDAPC